LHAAFPLDYSLTGFIYTLSIRDSSVSVGQISAPSRDMEEDASATNFVTGEGP